MTVFRSLGEAAGKFDRPVAAIGNFDGLHLGHKAIIDEAVRRAESSGRDALVLTFEPHPQLVIGRQPTFTVLTSLEEKLRLLSKCRIAATLVMPFSREFAQTEPEEYVRTVYVETLNLRELIVGFSHAFGRRGRGTAELLQNLGKQLGFGVHVMPPLKNGEEVVSSSTIRRLLSDGLVDRANRLLDHPYTLNGRVVHGEGRGRKLQFPTANLSLDSPHLLIPKRGVYAVRVEVGDQRLNGVMNIGVRPTFGAGREVVEIHLLDYSGDLYDTDIRVELMGRIRDEIKFSSVEQLKVQIANDINETRAMLGSA